MHLRAVNLHADMDLPRAHGRPSVDGLIDATSNSGRAGGACASNAVCTRTHKVPLR